MAMKQGMWKTVGGVGAALAGYILVADKLGFPAIPVGEFAWVVGIASILAGYMLIFEY